MKRLVFFGIGLITGAGIGAGLAYIFTKNACEKQTQLAIDDMKHFYEDTHKTVKGFEVKEGSDEKKEEAKDVVRLDKPPISEMSSLHNSDSDNYSGFTNYHMQNNSGDKEKEIDDKISDLKKTLKKITNVTPAVNRFAVIDHAEYVKKQNSGYSSKDYSYDPGSEEWIDEITGTTLEGPEDLPFDPIIIQWNDLEQCYIVDEQLQSVYMLEQI